MTNSKILLHLQHIHDGYTLRVLMYLLVALTILCFMQGYAWADTFIARGSVWSYLDDGTNQGSAWREWAFDDTSWSTGNAQLGYSPDEIARFREEGVIEQS